MKCHLCNLVKRALIHNLYSISHCTSPLSIHFSPFLSSKLRKRDASKFHIQLCIALFCMLLFFLVGINRTENDVACTVMSLVILYFTLAAVLWMGAEAVLMFQKLIIVFGRITTRYIVVVSLTCWCKYTVVVSTPSPPFTVLHGSFFVEWLVGHFFSFCLLLLFCA